MNNDIVYVIEGVDRSGKDAIAVEIGKKTDFKYPFLIRGPIGYDVYNKLHNKKFDSTYYERLAKKMQDFTYTFFIDCNEQTIQKRMIDTNELQLRGGLSIIDNITAYREVFFYYKNVLKINNLYLIENNSSLENVTNSIIDIINKKDIKNVKK